MFTASNSPQLQPPGMGLPYLELLFARVLVAIKLRQSTVEKARKVFTAEKGAILSLVQSFTEEAASTQILIPRLRGLEDSSRYWSLYMTMEHLRIVNQVSITIIADLMAGIKPALTPTTAAVKPAVGVDGSVVARFTSVCEEFENQSEAFSSLKSTETLVHPWFGELNAEQWHFFAGFHMTLHRKQMVVIAEKLRTLSK
jgi:hypothetical protein